MKLLDIVKQCCWRTGDNAVSNVFADEDNAREWLGYISQALPLIVREHDWSMLTKDAIITTKDDTKAYMLPQDFNHMASNRLYNQTDRCHIAFANNDAELAKIVSGDTSQTSVRFRIMGGKIVFTYPIEAKQKIYYTYISSYAVIDENGNEKETFTSNEDQFMLNDELLILKAIALRAVNLGLAEADRREADYQSFLQAETVNDGANVQYNIFDGELVNKTTPSDWSAVK